MAFDATPAAQPTPTTAPETAQTPPPAGTQSMHWAPTDASRRQSGQAGRPQRTQADSPLGCRVPQVGSMQR